MRRVMLSSSTCVDADSICSIEVIDEHGESNLGMVVALPNHRLFVKLTRPEMITKLHELGFFALASEQDRS